MERCCKKNFELDKEIKLFSSENRSLLLNKIKSQSFDITIIGGGITGSGICLDAVSRGFKVCLIEMNDFASGTSSKSTKLIHGGLRYLEQFNFSLVRETGKERAVLHYIAPHIVKPEKMLIPISKGGKLNRFSTSLALSVYDFLANVKKKDRKKLISKDSIHEKEPLLSNGNIKGGAIYSEYRTDDSRLTIEILKKSYKMGAYPINYVKFISSKQNKNNSSELKCRDQISGKEFQINSKVIVNAAGAWVDNVVEGKKNKLVLSKGVHIVIPKDKLPLNQSIYFDAVDDRMVFAIPRRETVYIGTTDTLYNRPIDDIRVNKEEVEYLLDSVNNFFDPVLKIDDVISSWVGLRPLIKQDKKNVTEISRKDEIFISDEGIISIAGGKLTGYRKMAERVLKQISKKINITISTSKTDKLKISTSSFEICLNKVSTHFDEKISRRLFNRYGEDILKIHEIYIDLLKKYKSKFLVFSELIYCIENEMCHNLTDFFTQRNSMAYFEIQKIKKEVKLFKSLYIKLEGKSSQIFLKEKKELDSYLKKISTFI